jgi:UrcA family protein
MERIQMSRSVHFLCASALLFTGLAVTTPVMAQEAESQTVYFGDLDLWSEDGADALVRRIRNAADNVCGDTPGASPVVVQHEVRACEVETTEYAIEDLAHPMVTARFYGRNPQVIIEEGDADPYREPYYATPYYTVQKK